MERYIKIENNPNLLKDSMSGAVVSHDTTAYTSYINSRTRLLNDKQRIDGLEYDVSEIKDMLQIILNRIK